MKIIAGGRGSGKTYQLIHMAAEHDNGYYVCDTFNLARHLSEQYRDVLPKDRFITYAALNDSRGRNWRYGTLFIDSLRSGDVIPEEWHQFEIAAVAVEGPSAYSNPHVSDTYKSAVRNWEIEKGDSKN